MRWREPELRVVARSIARVWGQQNLLTKVEKSELEFPSRDSAHDLCTGSFGPVHVIRV